MFVMICPGRERQITLAKKALLKAISISFILLKN